MNSSQALNRKDPCAHESESEKESSSESQTAARRSLPGDDIRAAAERGRLGAVRRFLREDPSAVQKKDFVGCAAVQRVWGFAKRGC